MNSLKQVSQLVVGAGKFTLNDSGKVYLGHAGQHVATDGTVHAETGPAESLITDAMAGPPVELTSAEFFARFTNAATSVAASASAVSTVTFTALAKTTISQLIEFFSKAELAFADASAQASSAFGPSSDVVLTSEDGRSTLTINSEVLTKIRAQLQAYLRTDVFAQLKNIETNTVLEGMKVKVGPGVPAETKLGNAQGGVFTTFEAAVAQERPVQANYQSNGQGTVCVTVNSETLAALRQVLANEANAPAKS